MSQTWQKGPIAVTRREVLRGAAAGLAVIPVFGAARTQAPAYPQIPVCTTGMRQPAPGACACTQATGPGVKNASLSNAARNLAAAEYSKLRVARHQS